MINTMRSSKRFKLETYTYEKKWQKMMHYWKYIVYAIYHVLYYVYIYCDRKPLQSLNATCMLITLCGVGGLNGWVGSSPFGRIKGINMRE